MNTKIESLKLKMAKLMYSRTPVFLVVQSHPYTNCCDTGPFDTTTTMFFDEAKAKEFKKLLISDGWEDHMIKISQEYIY